MIYIVEELRTQLRTLQAERDQLSGDIEYEMDPNYRSWMIGRLAEVNELIDAQIHELYCAELF
jgi:hypothetical protein